MLCAVICDVLFCDGQVEQLGELRVLWVRRTYTTWLTVTEDSRDPAHLITTFELLKSVSSS